MDMTYPAEQPPSLWLRWVSLGTSSFPALLSGSSLSAQQDSAPIMPIPPQF